jgi:hypothetical protein
LTSRVGQLFIAITNREKNEVWPEGRSPRIEEAAMNTVLLYTARSVLSFMVALTCSAEARAASIGQEPAPIIALASQLPARGSVVSYRTENPRAPRR